MAWRTVPDSEVDSDSPVTQELMFALRDNPEAIALGNAGAPRIVRGALDTATSSVSGSLLTDASATITLNAYSFFPSITHSPGGAGGDVRVEAVDGAGGADAPKFDLHAVGTDSTYTVYWRYIVA